ncbi:hypothetical protein VULLAG_LOCUS3421 [Vulpes lagopus]
MGSLLGHSDWFSAGCVSQGSPVRLYTRSFLKTMMKREFFSAGTLGKRTTKAWNCQSHHTGISYLSMKPKQREAEQEDGDKFLIRSTRLLDSAMPEAMPALGFFRAPCIRD